MTFFRRRVALLLSLLSLVLSGVLAAPIASAASDVPLVRNESAADTRVSAMQDRIAAGGEHTCVLTDAGAVRCWGTGTNGRLGYAATASIIDPAVAGVVAMPGGRPAIALAAGSAHTCALLDTGRVTCWGSGSGGRLGYGNTNDIGDNETPAQNPVTGGIVQMPGGSTVVSISAGTLHTCAVLVDGTVTCWGVGSFGRLGFGNQSTIGDDETPAANPAGFGRVALPELRAVAVAAGGEHTCALLVNGDVSCWGSAVLGALGYGNTFGIGDTETPRDNPIDQGRVQLPGGLKAAAISAGNAHTCAILVGGAVVCWGEASFGRLGYGNAENIGDDETPAANPVSTGILSLPGSQLPVSTAAVAISAGKLHTCALMATGSVSCWGDGAHGVLGYGNVAVIGDNEFPVQNSAAPNGVVPLPGARTVSGLDVGDAHTCAILSTGGVTCWGTGLGGRLGYNNVNDIGDNETPAANPVRGGVLAFPGEGAAVSVAAGLERTCAITTGAKLVCWGRNPDGELGSGLFSGDIGDNELASANPRGAVALPGGRTPVSVVSGSSHTCALLDNGGVTCWGDAFSGALGYGNTNDIGGNLSPAQNPVNGGLVPLPGNRRAVAIDAGGNTTCALLDNGTVTCWGDGSSNGLGYGTLARIGSTVTPALNPVNGGIVPLPGTRPVVSISVGGAHACAVFDDGKLACWGFNAFGQLGYGNTTTIGDSETPAQNPVNGGFVSMPGKRKVRQVVASGLTTCVVLDTGRVACWGRGALGQLGYGNTNNIGDNETPPQNAVNSGVVALPGPTATAISLAAAGSSMCALLPTQQITCWGDGSLGALGYGNTNNIGDNETPATNPVSSGLVSMPGGRTVKALAGGSTHMCAVLSDGAVTCWGAGNRGGLGYGNLNKIGDNETPAANPVNGGEVPLPAALSAIDYRSVAPARLLDTRASGVTVDGQSQGAGQLLAQTKLGITAAGRGGVPIDAPAVTLTVAVVSPAQAGFLTVWPCADDQPNSSNINFQAGATTSNTVVTSTKGGVCFFSSSPTHLIADVVGFAPRTSSLQTLVPERLADTRANGVTIDGQAQAIGARAAGSTLTMQVAQRGSVPFGTREVVLNVAAVGPVAAGFISVHPCESPAPASSNINFAAGVATANLVVTALAADGTLCVFASATTHVIVDVVAVYSPSLVPNPSWVQSQRSTRLADTRTNGATVDGRFARGGQVVAGGTLVVQVTNRFPTNNASVVFINVTAVSPTANGFLTVFPCGDPVPNASNLNYRSGVSRAAMVFAEASDVGTICIFSSAATHLIVDTNGATL